MKKLLALLLAVALITLSTGCGGDNPSGDDNSQTEAQTDPKEEIKDTAEEETEADTEAPLTEKTEISRGTIDGDVYDNAFLGFKFTKPESWVYSTDEEIAAVMGISAEMMNADYSEIIDNNVAAIDMMAVDITTNSNINVTYENLSKSLSTNITIEQYVDAVEQQLSNMEDATFNISDEFETVTLGANEYTRVIIESTMYGIEMQQVYYLRKVDTYMCGIIVTIADGYSIADIEAMFE